VLHCSLLRLISQFHCLYLSLRHQTLGLLAKYLMSPKGLLGVPVQFLIVNRQLLQCISGCGPGQDNLLNSKLNVRMGKHERGMVVGARWAGLSISQSAQLLGF